MTSLAADVVVVGGGISGYAAAAAAAARGAQVILVEKEQQPAWEGSGRAQGSLRLQGRDAAELPLAREAIERWKELGDEVDCELRFGGNIYLCDDPDELPTLHTLVKDAHRAGLSHVRLPTPSRPPATSSRVWRRSTSGSRCTRPRSTSMMPRRCSGTTPRWPTRSRPTS